MDNTGDTAGASSSFWQRRYLGQTFDEYRHLKMLPHINGEYQFRITNKLLSQKIANPRRDRIIIDSLAHTASAHLQGSKMPPPSRQGLPKYRRKNILTAATNKRPSPASVHRQQEGKERVGARAKTQQRNFQHSCSKEEENRSIQADQIQSHFEGQQTRETMAESAQRRSCIGKIVKNHSAHLFKFPKKGHLYCNPTFDTTFGDEHTQPLQMPKQRIKKIVRRFYQNECGEKENES